MFGTSYNKMYVEVRYMIKILALRAQTLRTHRYPRRDRSSHRESHPRVRDSRVRRDFVCRHESETATKDTHRTICQNFRFLRELYVPVFERWCSSFDVRECYGCISDTSEYSEMMKEKRYSRASRSNSTYGHDTLLNDMCVHRGLAYHGTLKQFQQSNLRAPIHPHIVRYNQ